MTSINISDTLAAELASFAMKHRPLEACGVITPNGQLIRLSNIHPYPKQAFMIDNAELREAERRFGVRAIFHSHPDGTAAPSESDIAQCNRSNLPYVIYGCKDKSLFTQYPSSAALIGREYVHGVQDCYTIVQDYYKRELNITLRNYARRDGWWLDPDAASLYAENYENEGFVRVPKTSISDLHKHDLLISYWADTLVPNHALIYLGNDGNLTSEQSEPVLGSHLCLHHPYESKSSRFLLGDTRFSAVSLVLRHKELMND